MARRPLAGGAKRCLRLGLEPGGIQYGLRSIALSSLFENGTILVLAALLLMAFAQAAFPPTAAEAVIEETPPEHRVCDGAVFPVPPSAPSAALAGGALLDLQNNGLLLWLLMGGACLVVLPSLRSLKPRYGARTSADAGVPQDEPAAVARADGSVGSAEARRMTPH